MSGSLYQSGDDLIAIAHYVNSGSSATGLTVTIDLWRLRGGSWSEVVTGGSATEIGDGLYYYSYGNANVNAGDVYAAVFKTAGTVDQAHLPARLDIEGNYTATRAGYLDEAISAAKTLTSGALTSVATSVWAAGTRTLTSFGTLVADIAANLRNYTLEVRGPVVTTSLIDITAYDSYQAADSRALSFPVSDIDLTGATVTFAIELDGTVYEIGTGDITNAGDLANQAMRVQLTSAETDDLQPSSKKAEGRFQVRATLSGNVLTYYDGKAIVRRQLRA